MGIDVTEQQCTKDDIMSRVERFDDKLPYKNDPENEVTRDRHAHKYEAALPLIDDARSGLEEESYAPEVYARVERCSLADRTRNDGKVYSTSCYSG
jgi:hypothetical protein